MKLKKNLLIDGKFFAYRTITTQFHLTHNESRTGMYFGFINAALSMAKKFKPDNVIIMWDSNHSFRRSIYPEYKAKRNESLQRDENLIEQLKTIREEYENLVNWMHKVGFASYMKWGLEADDLFYYWVNQYSDQHNIIATKDEDLYQLLANDHVEIYDPKEKIIKTEKWFTNKYKIKPSVWADIKGIGGCISDNVKLLPGIAQDSALTFINSGGNIKIKKNKYIIDNWDKVEFAQKLVKLPFCYYKLLYKETYLKMDELISFFQKMGFRSFLDKIEEFGVFNGETKTSK
jgi:5'-3' exonuclease